LSQPDAEIKRINARLLIRGTPAGAIERSKNLFLILIMIVVAEIISGTPLEILE